MRPRCGDCQILSDSPMALVEAHVVLHHTHEMVVDVFNILPNILNSYLQRLRLCVGEVFTKFLFQQRESQSPNFFQQGESQILVRLFGITRSPIVTHYQSWHLESESLLHLTKVAKVFSHS